MKLDLNENFSELSMKDSNDIEGGVVGTICAVVGTLIAVGTAIYGYGYAKGQQAVYNAQ